MLQTELKKLESLKIKLQKKQIKLAREIEDLKTFRAKDYETEQECLLSDMHQLEHISMLK